MTSHKKPPEWYGQGYGNLPGWDPAVKQCRDFLEERARRGEKVTYTEVTRVVDAIPWPDGAFTHRGAQIGHLLGEVVVGEWLEDRPMLSAIVVGAESSIPGKGFYHLADELGLLSIRSDETDQIFWVKELERCFEYWRKASREERITGVSVSGRTQTLVALGVDGTRKGWVVVALKGGVFADAALNGSFQDVLDGYPDAALVAVDIPIGLPDGPEPRQADVAAKRFLGRGSSSVFPTPSRAVLEASTHAQASALAVESTGKGISQQSFALRRKILEVDPLVTDRVIEVHPEVSFRAMSDGVPLPSKKTWSGIMVRWRLLAEAGIEVPDDLGDAGLLPADDVLDAAAAAWSALRYTRGEAASLPEDPPRDGRGRPVAIWY